MESKLARRREGANLQDIVEQSVVPVSNCELVLKGMAQVEHKQFDGGFDSLVHWQRFPIMLQYQ